MELPIEVDFQLSPEDYKQSLKVFAGKAKNLRPQYIASTLLLVYTLWVLFTGGTTSLFFAIMGIAFLPIVLALQFVIAPMQMERRARQTESLTVAQHWSVDESGIQVTSELGSASYEWQEFRSVIPAEEFILLQYKANPNALVFLPTRAFSVPEVQQTFVALAEEQVKAGWRRK
jgi:hypothetical protein